MLRSLHVEHYALIDSLDVTFPEGLVIITGATGAGKSILLGALSLLTGSKAEPSAVADSAENCVVEAEFSVPDDAALKSIIEDEGIEWTDGNLTVRRVVSKSGRSRCFVSDCPVSQQFLSDIASHIVDIHGQHQSLMLSDKSWQMRILDLYAGNSTLLARTSESWRSLQNLRKTLEDTREKLSLLERDKDYNRSRFERLEKASLRDGELEELELEQKQLSNAEDIRSGLESASRMLSPSDSLSTAESLKEARKALEKVSRFVPESAGLASRLESARLEIEDIAGDVLRISDSIRVSPERLQAIDDRISLIYDLLRAYGCRDIAELLAEKDRLSAALFDSSELESKCRETLEAIEREEAVYDGLCAELHCSREKACGPFSEGLQQSMRFLELDRAVFRAILTEGRDSATGRDVVQFLFSSTGASPVDVSKCASGGEISRIVLCLKAMMARFAGMPTLIFDEIDTGVSGSAADRMGSMICDMGRDMQVFAITHLPQVAAKGDAHYKVSKSETSDGRVASTIEILDAEGRIEEIARLLSGSTVTSEAVANAKSLLSIA